MGRFILIAIAAVFVLVTLYRIFSGKKLNVLDWVLLLIGLVAVGSMISYIIQSN